MQRAVLLGVVGLALLASGVGEVTLHASPELALDDPAYDDLARLRASGALPPYLGGLRPLTEARVQALRRAAALAPDPLLLPGGMRGAWLAPVRRLRLRGVLLRDHLRPYSTEVHPRDLTGGVAVSCEHEQGRSCGDGAGLEWELDSAAGYGSWLSTAARVRGVAGTADYHRELYLDRAYVNAELGPFALLVGRDVLVVGPSARTQAIWGDHAPALDQVRVSTARPLPLLGARGSVLRASALFYLGRLRDPQRFDGTLVDGTRVQADLWDTAEIGLTHLIQLGGDGAPEFTFGDYVREHTRHNAESGEFANHRVAADVAVSFPHLAGLRVYYEVAAEDLRDQVASMLLHDADHILGVELGRLTPHGALLVELTRTGVRSHEHQLFTTGLTSAGRIAGNPLGPSSTALFAGARLDVATDVTLLPYLEVAHQSADLYFFPTGDIERTQDLPDEWRSRAGARARIQLTSTFRLEARILAERVTTADFIPGHSRWNGGAQAAATWTPAWWLGSPAGEP